MRAKNTFIFLAVFVALLWLFLSKSDPTVPDSEVAVSKSENVQNVEESAISAEVLSSTNEPIKIVELSSKLEKRELDENDRLEAQQKFNQATEYVLTQNWQKAETLYLDLIEELPLAVEPYINLAVVYTETNRLDEARKVLTRGVKANPNYATLFDNLRSIHGSLAAKAYRAALIAENETSDIHQDESIKLDLSLINSMDLRLVDLSREQALSKQINDLQTTMRSEQLELQASQERVAKLEQELETANTQIASLDESTLRIETLESQLQQQADAFASSEQELIASNESMSVELAATQKTLLETTENAVTVTEDTVVAAVASDLTSNSEPEKVVTAVVQDDPDDAGAAFKLVESWAAYWSDQDVDGYVSQYAGNYSPQRSELSHRQWLEQRQVRLTNKEFIQVDVSDLEYDRSDENQFSVTFTQRYRSNTIDDTIRKRLVFTENGSSVLDAKIIDEIIVSN